eukprot:scaffold83886_cov38-Prasinocladus_malaysianus.AAC.1
MSGVVPFKGVLRILSGILDKSQLAWTVHVKGIQGYRHVLGVLSVSNRLTVVPIHLLLSESRFPNITYLFIPKTGT